MRAFTLAVLKLCALCRDIIEQAIVYDEVCHGILKFFFNFILKFLQEDYQSQTYGFDFANQYSVVEILHVCATAVEELLMIKPVRKSVFHKNAHVLFVLANSRMQSAHRSTAIYANFHRCFVQVVLCQREDLEWREKRRKGGQKIAGKGGKV
jgi:hypothetical protein